MKKTGWLVLGLALAVGIATVGWLPGTHVKSGPFSALSQPDRNLAIFDAFVDQLREHYFDAKLVKSSEWGARFEEFRRKAQAAADDSHLYADVLYPLAHSFPDSHVEVFWPQASAPAASAPAAPPPLPKTVGDLGFEFVLMRRDKIVRAMVGDVRRDSPAERAGIAPGYVIQNLSSIATKTGAHLKVELDRYRPDEVRSFERHLKGPTPLYPDVPTAAEAESRKFIAERRFTAEYDYDVAPAASFEHRMLADGVIYVRFDNFMEKALIDQVVAVIDRAPPNGLIVDLRHNVGGLTTETHRVLDRLLGHDAYIGTYRRGLWFEDVRTDKDGPVYTGPLVVLIGPLSASAAEITAAAVLDNHRGLLVGRMTNGSVMEANYFSLPDGGRVQIPVNDFVRGHDRRIDSVGVEPDIWILPTLDDVRAGRDPALARALKEINGKELSAAPSDRLRSGAQSEISL